MRAEMASADGIKIIPLTQFITKDSMRKVGYGAHGRNRLTNGTLADSKFGQMVIQKEMLLKKRLRIGLWDRFPK